LQAEIAGLVGGQGS